MLEHIKEYKRSYLSGFFILVVIPLVTFFEVPFPKPAWASDIMMLDLRQTETAIVVYEDQRQRLRLDSLKNRKEQQQYRSSDKEVPDFLLEEQSLLTERLDKTEQMLQEARDRKIMLSK